MTVILIINLPYYIFEDAESNWNTHESSKDNRTTSINFEIIQFSIILTFISSFYFVCVQKNSKIVILSLFLQNLEFICATAELVDNSLEETQTQMIKFSDT